MKARDRTPWLRRGFSYWITVDRGYIVRWLCYEKLTELVHIPKEAKQIRIRRAKGPGRDVVVARWNCERGWCFDGYAYSTYVRFDYWLSEGPGTQFLWVEWR